MGRPDLINGKKECLSSDKIKDKRRKSGKGKRRGKKGKKKGK